MKDEAILDTNVIHYAYDLSEPSKRKACEALMERALHGEMAAAVSNQILVELYNSLTRKGAVSDEKAKIIVKMLIASDYIRKVNYTHDTVDKALNIAETFEVPFLDALIMETMKENGISKIITENEKDFSKVSGFIVRNPFKP